MEIFQIFQNYEKNIAKISFKPIQDGRAKKAPPTSFSPVTSANVRISPPKLSNF